MEKMLEILEEHKQKLLFGLIGILLVLVVLLSWQNFQPEALEEAPGTDLYEELLAENSEEAENPAYEEQIVEGPQDIIVDVKGAVAAPGVYTMGPGQRVIDAIEQAGGFVQEAEQNAVNLAKVVEDQMVIYIPKIGEEDVHQDLLNEAAAHPQETENDKPLVDINHAEKEALITLNGIGDAKAENILKYREESGPFQTIEDIKNVSGIGEATFENLKDQIKVSP